MYDNYFLIGERIIGNYSPTYFIADIGANHDGDLSRAKELIKLARDAGADCAKFQHFRASKIVSAVGFDGFKTAHQRGWDKSVFEVYEDYSINPDWNEVLAATCKENSIDFMTTPYDFESVVQVNPLVKAFKIGSGDITYHQLIRFISLTEKPVFLATGASTMEEVEAAVAEVLSFNSKLCLMQCNTNYTGDWENFRYVNLNVLRSFSERWPDMPLGLSDHTAGYAAPLGAVAMGARVIEKHFTDDPSRNGPDHKFALSPEDWRAMVQATRQLEMAIGEGNKTVERNELESRVVQRRAIRLKSDQAAGTKITGDMLDYLRPCPNGACTPAQAVDVIGRILKDNKASGEAICPKDLVNNDTAYSG